MHTKHAQSAIHNPTSILDVSYHLFRPNLNLTGHFSSRGKGPEVHQGLVTCRGTAACSESPAPQCMRPHYKGTDKVLMGERPGWKGHIVVSLTTARLRQHSSAAFVAAMPSKGRKGRCHKNALSTPSSRVCTAPSENPALSALSTVQRIHVAGSRPASGYRFEITKRGLLSRGCLWRLRRLRVRRPYAPWQRTKKQGDKKAEKEKMGWRGERCLPVAAHSSQEKICHLM